MNKLYVVGSLLMAVALMGFWLMTGASVNNRCDPADPECRPTAAILCDPADPECRPAPVVKLCDPADPECRPDSNCAPPSSC